MKLWFSSNTNSWLYIFDTDIENKFFGGVTFKKLARFVWKMTWNRCLPFHVKFSLVFVYLTKKTKLIPTSSAKFSIPPYRFDEIQTANVVFLLMSTTPKIFLQIIEKKNILLNLEWNIREFVHPSNLLYLRIYQTRNFSTQI